MFSENDKKGTPSRKIAVGCRWLSFEQRCFDKKIASSVTVVGHSRSNRLQSRKKVDDGSEGIIVDGARLHLWSCYVLHHPTLHLCLLAQLFVLREYRLCTHRFCIEGDKV